jgi:hypothetical protein
MSSTQFEVTKLAPQNTSQIFRPTHVNGCVFGMIRTLEDARPTSHEYRLYARSSAEPMVAHVGVLLLVKAPQVARKTPL